MKKNQTQEVTLFNQDKIELMENLNMGEDGMASLTGLWKYAGSPKNMNPNDWTRTDQGMRFIESTCRILNTVKNRIIKTRRGRYGGTYGINQIVLEYAKYLDTDLSVLVNEVFFERVAEEKNPELIIDRAVATYKRKGYSDEWIAKRLKGKARRNEFTACLAKHGVSTPDGFRRCTNAIYEPLYGGGASLVRARKNLPDTAKIRDNMSEIELSAVEFAESLSKHNIEIKRASGSAECEIECANSSKIVAAAIVESRKPVGVF